MRNYNKTAGQGGITGKMLAIGGGIAVVVAVAIMGGIFLFGPKDTPTTDPSNNGGGSEATQQGGSLNTSATVWTDADKHVVRFRDDEGYIVGLTFWDSKELTANTAHPYDGSTVQVLQENELVLYVPIVIEQTLSEDDTTSLGWKGGVGVRFSADDGYYVAWNLQGESQRMYGDPAKGVDYGIEYKLGKSSKYPEQNINSVIISGYIRVPKFTSSGSMVIFTMGGAYPIDIDFSAPDMPFSSREGDPTFNNAVDE
jgi:hypothetical protein